MNLGPRIEPEKEMLTPTKDLKKVQIGPWYFQVTKLGTSLFEEKEEEEEEKLVALLRGKIDMPDVDANVYHLHSEILSQRKHKRERGETSGYR